MPLYLDTRGNSTLGIGICSRCSRKMSLDKLQPDPNYPGLRVCEKDADQFDPYRLPPRQADNITLPFMRTDTPIPTNPNGAITQNELQFLISENNNDFIVFLEDDGL